VLDNPINMKRPAGVTVIATFSVLAAAYLSSIGALMLVAPGKISIMNRALLMYGLKVANPYATLLVAAIWGIVGWGLFNLFNWARWASIFLSIVGFSSALARIPSASGSGRMLLLIVMHVAVRVAVVWYLIQSSSSGGGSTKWQTVRG
jgi:hypothetical protein